MSSLFWLTIMQMARLQPFFPKSHGTRRFDYRHVLNGIIFINRKGLRWCDAPRDHGRAKTFDNRWKRLVDKGVFAGMMEGLTTAIARHAASDEGSARRPIAQPTPKGVNQQPAPVAAG
jgi:transposase